MARQSFLIQGLPHRELPKLRKKMSQFAKRVRVCSVMVLGNQKNFFYMLVAAFARRAAIQEGERRRIW